MRKNYISNEFNNVPINGFNNSGAENSIFINTIPNLPLFISIDEEDIIYYENEIGEQFSTNNDNYGLSAKTINSTDIKNTNSVLNRNTENGFTLKIDILKLFNDYVFGLVKKHGMFNDLTKVNCINSDVNLTIRNYITKSIFTQFIIDKINFYLVYNDLTQSDNLLNNFSFNSNIKTPSNLLLNCNTKYDSVNDILDINFNTIKSLKNYNFDYYYSLTFQNINR
jgi:hypothetical protein